jgi:glycosyltransferase involved in cell wall biosynthesis
MKRDKKVCFLLNFASHYRTPIFQAIDKDINCEFYFGDKTRTTIKKMDYGLLSNFKGEFKFIPLISNFNWLKGTLKLIFKNYDVFILTGEAYCLSNWVLLLFYYFRKEKVYLWTHGWYGKEHGFSKLLKKFFYGLGDGLLLYGDYAKKIMVDEGFDENKLTPIYNSLDYDRHVIIRNSLTETNVFNEYFKNNADTLIYVGRLQKTKRIDLIFQAITNLKLEGILINLCLVGESSDIHFSKDLLVEYGIQEQVWIYGPCYDEEKLGELFYNANVCVSPGNVGLTAIHSLSFGTPVITHGNLLNQMPEFEVIEEGVTGSFFEENDVNSLTNKIKIYIATNNDEKAVMRENCYRIIDSKYNPYFQIDVLKKLLDY